MNETSVLTQAPAPVAHPAMDPAHPHHHAFNWGIFLALLAFAAQTAAPFVGGLTSPAIGAALAGGAVVLGKIDVAVIASTTDPATADPTAN